MKFRKFWQGRNGKESINRKGSINKDLLPLDLLSQMSYMSAVATSGIARGMIFEQASRLPYVSSRYFRDVYVLCNKLNYDYSEACRLVGQTTQEEDVKSLLLRLSSSLSAGEPQEDFLDREARVLADTFGDEYERKLESTKKWTDGYVALMVSAALITIVAVISMMIYQTSVVFLFGLAGLTVLVTVAGAWIIYRASPKERKTHSLPQRSREQHYARKLFKILVPIAVIAGALAMLLGLGLGWALILAAALILPVGLLSARDDGKIDNRDADIAAFLRALGGVAKATGTTITEALSRVDTRATGSLAPEVKKLHVRLLAGIEPALCWSRFVAETGSELIDRTVRVFWDGIIKGGDPEEVGVRASFFAMKISLLRAKRRLISSTFGWLSLPMHAAITGLLMFIVHIMDLFGKSIQSMTPSDTPNSLDLPIGALASLGAENMGMLNNLVTMVILVLTAVNAFSVHAAGGAHNYKLLYHLGTMMAITGAVLLLVPLTADMIFGSVAAIGG